ncbi:MAG TPA: hypothetical protein PLB92_00290 [Rhodoglobus sp.]|nr:hypothetical protein [Rhodoglobus sp.]
MTNNLVRVDRSKIIIGLMIVAALILVIQAGIDIREVSFALRTTPWFQD